MPEPGPAARARRQSGPSDARKRLYGAVRAACARRGLDEDDRRALQADVTGKTSLRDMSIAELGRVLDRLNRDWAGPMGHRPHIGKIKALWWTLYWLGEVERADDRAISGFVFRQTGVAALRFLDHRRAPSVIEALKAWAGRAGVDWPAGQGSARDDRLAVLDALALRCGLRDGAALAADLGLDPDSRRWDSRELDAAIRHLGQLCRAARPSGRGPDHTAPGKSGGV